MTPTTTTLHEVVDAGGTLSPTLTPHAMKPMRPPRTGLTATEMKVMILMAEGLDNRAIALRLGNKYSTIKVYVSSVLTKTRMPRAGIIKAGHSGKVNLAVAIEQIKRMREQLLQDIDEIIADLYRVPQDDERS